MPRSISKRRKVRSTKRSAKGSAKRSLKFKVKRSSPKVSPKKRSTPKVSPKVSPKTENKQCKSNYAVIFSMYIGEQKERRDVYENRVKRWLDETSCIDFYTTDSSNNYLFFDKKTGKPTSHYYNDPRLHQFAFQQDNKFQSGNPSVPERNALLKALEHFKNEFQKYRIVFKITGKYFIPNFDKLIKFESIPKDTQIVFQSRTDTNGQNTEVIGFAPAIFADVIKQINDDITIEALVAGINKRKLYKTYRLPKLKLDAFTKRSDGSTLRYLFDAVSTPF